METKTCKECGRELEISNFKKTRWGGGMQYLQPMLFQEK